eukprot:2295102-Rhodomonas_salina.1
MATTRPQRASFRRLACSIFPCCVLLHLPQRSRACFAADGIGQSLIGKPPAIANSACESKMPCSDLHPETCQPPTLDEMLEHLELVQEWRRIGVLSHNECVDQRNYILTRIRDSGRSSTLEPDAAVPADHDGCWTSIGCSICLDTSECRAQDVGLLAECAHMFCARCIAGWAHSVLTDDMAPSEQVWPSSHVASLVNG